MGGLLDPIDTVIKLTRQSGYGLQSQGKTVTMSGPEVPGWGTKQAVDGDNNTGWSSEMVKEGDKPWVMIDIGDVIKLSRVHLYPRVLNDVVGYNFPLDFEFSVSADGNSFKSVLTFWR